MATHLNTLHLLTHNICLAVHVDCTCTGSLLQWFLTFTCCTIVTHQLCDDDSRAFATKDMVREILSNVMRPCVCKASLNGVPFYLFSSTLLVLPHCWIPARSPAGFKAAPIHSDPFTMGLPILTCAILVAHHMFNTSLINFSSSPVSFFVFVST